MSSNYINLLQEKTIKYQDHKVSFFSNLEHNDSRETIVLLHPAFTDHRIFTRQIEYFNDTYQIVALDMIGHGQNASLSGKLTLEDMPGIVSEIVSQYDLNKVHVIGVSLGSLVAQAIAYQYPTIIKTITVVGGYSIHKDNEEIIKAQGKEMGKWLLKIIFSMNRFREYVSTVSTSSLEGKTLFKQGTMNFKRKSFVAMQGMSKLMIPVDKAMLYPMLLVVGENDLKLALNAAKNLNKIEPLSELVIIEKAGHCANIDNHLSFNTKIEDYIKKHIGVK